MSPEKLTRMANQIAIFFDSQPGDPAENTARHLRDFWDPRMRAQLIDIAATENTDLLPSALAGARLLGPVD